jgi:hypothetical protein
MTSSKSASELPQNCIQTMEMLGTVAPHGSAALRRVSFYRTHGKAAADEGTLETWTRPVGENRVEQLLVEFSEPQMLKAAQSIPNNDLSLREDSRQRLAAYIADTTVDIDLEQRTILRRCPVWSGSILQKRFSPHVAKLFLSINPERSRSVLSLIQSELDNWKFESRLAVGFRQ